MGFPRSTKLRIGGAHPEDVLNVSIYHQLFEGEPKGYTVFTHPPFSALVNLLLSETIGNMFYSLAGIRVGRK